MKPASVSVIIPARNAASTIRRQLEAVCAQALDLDVEVLVVDNGSTDATADVVRGLASAHPEVRLVAGPTEPNRSAARNLAAQQATGEILAFCDADDIVQAGWLRALCEALADHHVATGALLRLTEDELGSAASGALFGTEYRGLRCVGANNFAIRRAAFEDVGGFSEDFKHRVDIELSCRLLMHDIDIAYEPGAVVHYTRRADRRSEVRQHFWWAVADARILAEYGDALPLRYSWKNSVKHWLLLGPKLVRAVTMREDVTPQLLTAATLAGRTFGSVRHRTWAV